MEEVSYQELLTKAEDAVSNGSTWHHHYLPPGCILNTKQKHTIVLEVEKESVVSAHFAEMPMQELERLENLFFSRN